MAAKVLQASRSLDLPTLPSGWEVAAVGIGPESDVLILAADELFETRQEVGRVSRYRVYRLTQESPAESLELTAPARAAYMFVQPMGDDVLLVASRAYGGLERNAHLWSRDGHLVASFSLGDGIEDVQVSASSEIWVSYFDEGVFSDRGEPGLACFDKAGHRTFAYTDVVDRNEVPPIDDCYALNVVSSDEVWLYYYSAFPLVRLVDKQLAGIWPRAPGLGAHAFAVGERTVIFAGDYGDRSAITRYFPESGRSEMAHAIGNGLQLEFTRASGRADSLYLVANSAIWLVQAD
jgi:hypothetical protein